MRGVQQTVKQVAARVELPARTVRYYDRIGLVCPERSTTGYRLYSPEEESKLRFVRDARGLGFSLDDIRDLLDVTEPGADAPQGVPELVQLLDAKIADVDAHIDELHAFRERLASYRGRWSGTRPNEPRRRLSGSGRLPAGVSSAYDAWARRHPSAA